MDIFLHNTRTRTKERFEPASHDDVSIYVCGPTVYDRVHIGNGRPAVVFDVLVRVLRLYYKNVRYVRNITDIDDKINAAAQATAEPIAEITDRFAVAYQEDVAALGVLEPTVEPRATGHIPEIIDMIKLLVERGHAYEADGHVLFDVPSDPGYGSLSRRSLADMIDGARVEVAPYKRDPKDFVLWKPSTEDLPGWESPWGRGRPGWHIECSAMIHKHLGPTIDIHGGGNDLTFPHHENELAQSESCTGQPFARFWLHNGLMQSGTAAGKVGGGHDRHGEIESSPDGDLEADQRDQVAGKLAGSLAITNSNTAVTVSSDQCSSRSVMTLLLIPSTCLLLRRVLLPWKAKSPR